jgi:hypothetical protein
MDRADAPLGAHGPLNRRISIFADRLPALKRRKFSFPRTGAGVFSMPTRRLGMAKY